MVGNQADAAAALAPPRREFWIAVVAVLAVLVLLYAAPTVMYRWVGESTADRWAEQLRLPKPVPTKAYECPLETPAAQPRPQTQTKAATKAKASAVAPGALEPTANKPVPGCRPLSAVELNFLDQSEQRLVDMANFHLGVARELFKWQYLATLSGLVAGTLTAAALLVISLQGLPRATLWMKSVFVVCSATAAFWVAIPQLYRYAGNQSAALKGYSLATSAMWQVRAARAGSLDGEGKWVDGPRFVSALPARLAEIGALSLSFDESKMHLPELKVPSP